MAKTYWSTPSRNARGKQKYISGKSIVTKLVVMRTICLPITYQMSYSAYQPGKHLLRN